MPPIIPRCAYVGAIRFALMVACAGGAFACAHDAVAPPPAQIAEDDSALIDWALPSVVDEPEILDVPTYEGTGQAVHPDIVAFPEEWNGARYWFAMTPYPVGISMFENPSILFSNDGLKLTVPPGVINPIIKPLGETDYNSDPDLIYDVAHHELVMSYRVVKDGHNTIKIITSHDGVHWGEPHVAFSEQNHSAVSQTIVIPSHAPATAWYVDAGRPGCSAITTRVMMRQASVTTMSLANADWGAPVETDMAVPGHLVWHLKVRYVPSKREYWALIVAYPADGRGCGSDDLFLGHSKDGKHWEVFPQPMLHHQDRWWTAGALYRGSFAYDAAADQLAVWFSARGQDERWRIGFVRMDYSDLAAKMSRAPASLATMPDSARPIWKWAP